MRRTNGMRGVLAVLVLAGCLAATLPSGATTIPLPKGVVIGKDRFVTKCYQYHCVYSRLFLTPKFSGRLRGVYVVGSATYMQYDSIQYFCPFGPCPPTTPTLVRAFALKGTTAAGAAFEATCSSGRFGLVIEELGRGYGITLVRATCNGGTASNSGDFAFDFVLPVDAPETTGLEEAPVFAGLLVEV